MNGPGNIIDNSARFGKGKKEPVPEAEMTDAAKELLVGSKIPDPPDYEVNLDMKGDRMLIQQFPHAEKIGSIYTPQNMELPIDKGRIIAVGPDVKNVKVGQVIFKVAGLGQQLKDNRGKLYIFLPENAAIAVDKDFDREDAPKIAEEPELGNDNPIPPSNFGKSL